MRFPLRAAAAVCVLSLVGAKGAVPEPKPKTASAYATLEAARDSVVAMVARTVTLPPRQISAAPCRFGYWYLPDSAAGYVYTGSWDHSQRTGLPGHPRAARAGWFTLSRDRVSPGPSE